MSVALTVLFIKAKKKNFDLLKVKIVVRLIEWTKTKSLNFDGAIKKRYFNVARILM